MATLESQGARSSGIRSWSLKRWLVLGTGLIIAVIAVALLVAFSGGGSGVGGGY